ncbi:hypothetical protein TRIUR3_29833 [Triticum urartu]|uniref:Uncharacterized protein n=1 Tax=Triticum urartu TaxID=4572 RepID=M7YSU8_TRIUA|nr:hypothetical protein TRIUR3_29833 [Triticum urartu]
MAERKGAMAAKRECCSKRRVSRYFAFLVILKTAVEWYSRSLKIAIVEVLATKQQWQPKGQNNPITSKGRRVVVVMLWVFATVVVVVQMELRKGKTVLEDRGGSPSVAGVKHEAPRPWSSLGVPVSNIRMTMGVAEEVKEER